MTIKKIGCIQIPVSNIKKAVAFYERVLGLKKTYENPVWTSFEVRGVTFALAVSGTRKREKVQKFALAAHYVCSDMQQVR